MFCKTFEGKIKVEHKNATFIESKKSIHLDLSLFSLSRIIAIHVTFSYSSLSTYSTLHITL